MSLQYIAVLVLVDAGMCQVREDRKWVDKLDNGKFSFVFVWRRILRLLGFTVGRGIQANLENYRYTFHVMHHSCSVFGADKERTVATCRCCAVYFLQGLGFCNGEQQDGAENMG